MAEVGKAGRESTRERGTSPRATDPCPAEAPTTSAAAPPPRHPGAEAPTTNRVYPLGRVEQIPVGEGRAFRVAGVSIAVFRTRSGALYATQAECPHRGGPLADGLLGGGKLVCPLHAYRFDLETGAPLGNECPALAVYRVEASAEGEVVLRV